VLHFIKKEGSFESLAGRKKRGQGQVSPSSVFGGKGGKKKEKKNAVLNSKEREGPVGKSFRNQKRTGGTAGKSSAERGIEPSRTSPGDQKEKKSSFVIGRTRGEGAYRCG